MHKTWQHLNLGTKKILSQSVQMVHGLNISSTDTLSRVSFVSTPYVYTNIPQGLNIREKVKTSKLRAPHDKDAKCFHAVK